MPETNWLDETMAHKLAVLRDRMNRNRLDGNKMTNWRWIDTVHGRDILGRIKIDLQGAELLETYRRVTSGYLCTKVRGYHTFHWLVKDPK